MSTIRYISLFSGIEAATVAWHQLGWKPIAYAEIEPFPKAVLRQHYPEVPDLTVRRLTPLECERLQGFPDGWTDIPWKGKKHSPDGPRYKALGNSMAVPVMRWIGEGIQLVEDNKELFKKDAQ